MLIETRYKNLIETLANILDIEKAYLKGKENGNSNKPEGTKCPYCDLVFTSRRGGKQALHMHIVGSHKDKIAEYFKDTNLNN